MPSLRVLITGANGLLGQALTDRLTSDPQYQLLATGRDDQTLHPSSPAYHTLDITDGDRVHELLTQFEPDVVVNCAAMTQVDGCEQQQEACRAVNTEAVRTMAAACQQLDIHLIQISTDFVFDGQSGPYKEDGAPNPVNFYGASKLEAEQAIQESGGNNWAIARTVLVYGTGHSLKRSNIALWLIEQLQQEKPVHIVTDQWRTPTYVHDLAKGIEQMISDQATGIYHLSGPELVSIYTFAQELARCYEYDRSLIHPTTSEALNQPAKRPPHTGFIIQKARENLGFQPRSIESALQDLGAVLGSV